MMKAASCALLRSSAQALSTGLRASGVAVNAVGKPPKHTSPSKHTALHNVARELEISMRNTPKTMLICTKHKY